jgi:hypothetical protein
MVAAARPADLASSSSSAGTCGHHFCRDCMKQYVTTTVKVSAGRPALLSIHMALALLPCQA